MIEIINISYGYANKILAENISKSILPRDRVGIVGGNGVGKTTLLKIIAKHHKPISGEIIYSKKDMKIVFVPANLNYFLLPWYNVKQNISFFLTGKEINNNNACGKLEDINQYLCNKEPDFLDKYVYCLSSGEKAVTALVCALSSDPDLIILDEIFSNVSNKVAIKIIDKLISTEAPVIFTTHAVSYMDKLATDTIYLGE